MLLSGPWCSIVLSAFSSLGRPRVRRRKPFSYSYIRCWQAHACFLSDSPRRSHLFLFLARWAQAPTSGCHFEYEGHLAETGIVTCSRFAPTKFNQFPIHFSAFTASYATLHSLLAALYLKDDKARAYQEKTTRSVRAINQQRMVLPRALAFSIHRDFQP